MAAMATGLSAAKVLRHSARRFGGLNRNFHAFGAVVVGIHPLPPFRAFSATASTSASTATTASSVSSVFGNGIDVGIDGDDGFRISHKISIRKRR